MGQHRAGMLMQHPQEDRRAILARAVVESEGVLVHAAFALGYSRRHLYRLIDQYRLWPIANRMRIKRLEREKRDRRRS